MSRCKTSHCLDECAAVVQQQQLLYDDLCVYFTALVRCLMLPLQGKRPSEACVSHPPWNLLCAAPWWVIPRFQNTTASKEH